MEVADKRQRATNAGEKSFTLPEKFGLKSSSLQRTHPTRFVRRTMKAVLGWLILVAIDVVLWWIADNVSRHNVGWEMIYAVPGAFTMLVFLVTWAWIECLFD
jgi:hypothetical protein